MTISSFTVSEAFFFKNLFLFSFTSPFFLVSNDVGHCKSDYLNRPRVYERKRHLRSRRLFLVNCRQTPVPRELRFLILRMTPKINFTSSQIYLYTGTRYILYNSVKPTFLLLAFPRSFLVNVYRSKPFPTWKFFWSYTVLFNALWRAYKPCIIHFSLFI